MRSAAHHTGQHYFLELKSFTIWYHQAAIFTNIGYGTVINWLYTSLQKVAFNSFSTKFWIESTAFPLRRWAQCAQSGPRKAVGLVDLNNVCALWNYSCQYMNERYFYKEYESVIVIMIQSSSTLFAIGTERVKGKIKKYNCNRNGISIGGYFTVYFTTTLTNNCHITLGK